MGTRGCGSGSKGSYKDHPHAYGDKSFKIARLSDGVGSSPRVWGQDWELLQEHYNLRIIPTRMGTSRASSDRCGRLKDHPHAYGDKLQKRY